MEWVTTSTIIHDLRDLSNQTAWRSFVDRFHRPIVRFVTRMGFNGEDAEDVTQETLAAFADSLREGRYDRERGKLRTWLFGIAYNKGLDQKRKARRQNRLIDGDAELALLGACESGEDHRREQRDDDDRDHDLDQREAPPTKTATVAPERQP